MLLLFLFVIKAEWKLLITKCFSGKCFLAMKITDVATTISHPSSTSALDQVSSFLLRHWIKFLFSIRVKFTFCVNNLLKSKKKGDKNESVPFSHDNNKEHWMTYRELWNIFHPTKQNTDSILRKKNKTIRDFSLSFFHKNLSENERWRTEEKKERKGWMNYASC